MAWRSPVESRESGQALLSSRWHRGGGGGGGGGGGVRRRPGPRREIPPKEKTAIEYRRRRRRLRVLRLHRRAVVNETVRRCREIR